MYPYIEKITEYLRAHGMSQATFAKRVGYSSTVISLYLKQNYNSGDLGELNEAFRQFFEAEQAYSKYQRDIKDVIITSQVREVLGSIMYVERRQSFGVVVGEAGIGKTVGFEEYYRTHRALTMLITMDRTKHSQTAFVQHLWRKIPGNRTRKSMPRAALLIDDIIYYFTNMRKTILIDEAQFLSNDALEVARSIQDQAKVGFVLGGTFDIDQLFGFGGRVPVNAQLHSRVRVHCEVNPTIQREDLEQVGALYGVDDAEMIGWLLDRCNQPGRRYRWVSTVLNATLDFVTDYKRPVNIKSMEQAAKMTGLPM